MGLVCNDFPHCPWCQARVGTGAKNATFKEHPAIPIVFMLTVGEARAILDNTHTSDPFVLEVFGRMKKHVDKPGLTHVFPKTADAKLPKLQLGVVVNEPIADCYLCQHDNCVQTMDDDDVVAHTPREAT